MSKRMQLRSREWRVYVEDMLTGCQDVQDFTRNKSFEDLVRDKGLNYSTLHALQIIGEAANNIPDDIQAQMPHIDWRGIVGVRNVIAHGYAVINYTTIWDIIHHQIPELERQLTDVLKAT